MSEYNEILFFVNEQNLPIYERVCVCVVTKFENWQHSHEHKKAKKNKKCEILIDSINRMLVFIDMLREKKISTISIN